jgi:hypothetical protein
LLRVSNSIATALGLLSAKNTASRYSFWQDPMMTSHTPLPVRRHKGVEARVEIRRLEESNPDWRDISNLIL